MLQIKQSITFKYLASCTGVVQISNQFPNPVQPISNMFQYYLKPDHKSPVENIQTKLRKNVPHFYFLANLQDILKVQNPQNLWGSSKVYQKLKSQKVKSKGQNTSPRCQTFFKVIFWGGEVGNFKFLGGPKFHCFCPFFLPFFLSAKVLNPKVFNAFSFVSYETKSFFKFKFFTDHTFIHTFIFCVWRQSISCLTGVVLKRTNSRQVQWLYCCCCLVLTDCVGF